MSIRMWFDSINGDKQQNYAPILCFMNFSIMTFSTGLQYHIYIPFFRVVLKFDKVFGIKIVWVHSQVTSLMSFLPQQSSYIACYGTMKTIQQEGGLILHMVQARCVGSQQQDVITLF